MKKLICILLALLVLCGCGAQAAGEETTPTWDGKHRAQIQGEEVTFEAWEQAGLPTEGCYYLTEDVILTQSVTVSGQLKLHLNGHTVCGTEGVAYGNFFVVPMGTEMTIYDEPEANGTMIAPRSYSGSPTVTSMFMVGGRLTMAGGTVDASAVALENVTNGTGFYLQQGAVLNVCGGAIIGGAALCTTLDIQPAASEDQMTEENEAETDLEPVEIIGKGGAVYVAAGAVCNVSGGVIRGGNAGLGGNVFVDSDGQTPGILRLTGGTVTSGEALFNGGNIYSCGKVELSGGELLSGAAYLNGGNVYCEAGTVEVLDEAYIYDGVSAKNKSSGLGGNFFIGPEASMTMTGGLVSEGKVVGNNNNLSANVRCEGSFTMGGGEITGRVSIVKTGTGYIYGSSKITGNGWQLSIEPTAEMVFGKCDEGTTYMIFVRLTHFDSEKIWNKGAVAFARLEDGVEVDINRFLTVKGYREGGTYRTFIVRQEGSELYFEENTPEGVEE